MTYHCQLIYIHIPRHIYHIFHTRHILTSWYGIRIHTYMREQCWSFNGSEWPSLRGFGDEQCWGFLQSNSYFRTSWDVLFNAIWNRHTHTHTHTQYIHTSFIRHTHNAYTHHSSDTHTAVILTYSHHSSQHIHTLHIHIMNRTHTIQTHTIYTPYIFETYTKYIYEMATLLGRDLDIFFLYGFSVFTILD